MRTVVVLGAGASLGNALYFRPERMRESRPPLDLTFFETVAGNRIPLSTPLRSYVRRVTGAFPTLESLRDVRMEEFFKDVFFDFQEDHTDTLAFDAYIDIVDLYLRVLRVTTNWLCEDGRKGAPLGQLLAATADSADDLTVITFNHDLVIENEIYRRARLRDRWCIDHGYGTLGPSLVVTAPTASVPVFHSHDAGDCDHTRPIRLLKLHGSLNWVVRINSGRPSVGFMSGNLANRSIYLITKRQLLGRDMMVRRGSGRTRWQTWPIVVPPVYAKAPLRSAIQSVWTDARQALEQADRVVFYGYSLPAIDVEAEKLFERAFASNTSLPFLEVVDPAPVAAARYAGLSRVLPVRWYPNIEGYLASGPFRPAGAAP
jgi:hypothetical protein